MKKYKAFLIILCCIMALSACSGNKTGQTETFFESLTLSADTAQAEQENEHEPLENPDIEEILKEKDVLLVRYISASQGVSTKAIEGAYASRLVDAVNALEQTNTTCEKISDEEFSFDHTNVCFADEGTYWLRIKEDIYRISPDCDEICKVNGYYGEGKYLKGTDGVFSLIQSLWKYYPRHTQAGTFENGTLSMSTVLDVESDVSIAVKTVTLSGSASPAKAENTVTLTVSSRKGSPALVVEAIASENDDEYAASSQQTVALSAGETKEITLSFGGWSDTYELYILAADARAVITVKP